MTKLKKTALAFGAACAFAFTGGIAALNAFPANAQTRAAGDRKYYGAKLSDELAQAFYDELVEMTVDPDGAGAELSEFRKGASHTVDSAVVLAAAEKYESDADNGSANFVKQFGAAVDCFRYDYNDLFWVDFDLLNFTVTKSENTTTGGGSEEGGSGSEAGGSDESAQPSAQAEGDGADDPAAATYTYAVTIGAGRAASYFLYDVTPEELNREKDAENANDKGGLMLQYEEAKTLLMDGDDTKTPVKKGVNDYISEAGAATTEAKAIAVNRYLAENFRYGYDFTSDKLVSGVDRFVATTGSVIPSNDNAKPLANNEGFARVYKLILNELGIECELVSGYYVSDGTTRACVWNYVKDGADWYAVDVANNLETKNQYLYQTGEIFSLDHFENKVVSLSNYKLSYPVLRTENYNVETGELQLADATYEGRECIAVQYKGASANKLAFRTKDESGVWTGWTKFEDYLASDGPKEPDPNPENPDENAGADPAALADGGDTGDTTESGTEPDPTPGEPGTEPDPTPEEPGTEDPGPTPEEPTYNIALKDGIYYLFNLTKGEFRIGVLDTNDKCIEYTETVKESFGNGVVPISLTSNPERRTAQDITKPFDVQITFPTDLQLIDANAPVGVEYTVGSVLGRKIPESFVKENCVLENVVWSSTGRTISFKFTPSRLLAHNGLKYTFTVTNLAEVETNALPQPYSVVFKFNELRAGGMYFGGSFYTDVVSQPSLVYNNGASFDGWKYLTTDTQGNEVENVVTENMLSSFALSVAKPVATADTAMTDAVKSKIANDTVKFKPDAYLASANYILDLTLDGHAVRAGANGYLNLAFPYPDGYGPEKNDSVSYRLVQFGKTESGEIDYDNMTLIEAIPLRQGIVASVNSFSTVAIVALESGKINSQYANSATRLVYTMTSGVGGKVETGSRKAINAVERNGDLITYTITADEGYDIAFVTLNGKDVTPVPTSEEGAAKKVYTYSVLYSACVIGSYPSANNVLNVEFVAASAKDDVAIGKTVAVNFVNKQLSHTAYSEAEKNEIIKDFPSGGTVYVPETPPIEEPEIPFDPNSTQMQYIIVGAVAGACVVIGFIVIIYCGAIKPKIVKEREEEAARIAANRERRANRNRIQPMNNLPPRDPQNPAKK